MTNKVLLCSDLDRTLLPNGPQPESPRARTLLHLVAGRPEVTLVYVTGRHRKLIMEAIETYDLPTPNYAVGDVGATIYTIDGSQWHAWSAWEEEIAPDWNGYDHGELVSLFEDEPELDLQESEKQGRFKLSYYTAEDIDHRQLRKRMQQRLLKAEINAELIWSIDEAEKKGLLDILPAHATKHHAVRFIMEHNGFSVDQTVFAGDSGNDMPALTSGLQAVLVRNASEEVRVEAENEMRKKGLSPRLYLARGDFLGMNGNYAAGVLEGLVHFIPPAGEWLADDAGGNRSQG